MMPAKENKKFAVAFTLMSASILFSGCDFSSSDLERGNFNGPAHDTSLEYFRRGPGAGLFAKLEAVQMKYNQNAASLRSLQGSVGGGPYLAQARLDHAMLNQAITDLEAAEGVSHTLWLQAELLPSRKLVARTVAEADVLLRRAESDHLKFSEMLFEKGYDPPQEFVKNGYYVPSQKGVRGVERNRTADMATGVRRPSWNNTLR
jgi:hypothetical protein